MARYGTKTVSLIVHTGTATADVLCRPKAGFALVQTIDQFTGTDATTPFAQWCEELWVRITACTACTVTATWTSTGQDVE